MATAANSSQFKMSSRSRRQYLIGAGALVSTAPIIAAANEYLSGHTPYDLYQEANFKTEEPVVRGTNVSTDSQTPDSYAALIRTQKESDQRYRVEYIQKGFDIDVSKLYSFNYNTDFVAIVGLVLPKRYMLEYEGREFDNGTLRPKYKVHKSSGLDIKRVHHNLLAFHEQGHSPPKDIKAQIETEIN